MAPSSDDLVPIYPASVQGELRQILQTKDLFVIAYKYLEEYNALLQEQNSILTKELVEERLNVLEAELKELYQEEYLTMKKLEFHAIRNEHLITHLEALGLCTETIVASARKLAFSGNTSLRHKAIIKKYKLDDPTFGIHPENPADEIRALQDEIVTRIKPILYFYRDLFYLQLHYSLVIVHLCSVCLPLVLQHISLVDRIFFWNERPEFEELRQSNNLLDRLREIYSRTQQVLNILIDCCTFLREKIRRKRELELKFNEYIKWQEHKKNAILKRLHAIKMDIDHLEEENDRMVGLIVKVDPSFVDSAEFKEIAELSLTHVFLNAALIGQGHTEAPCIKDEHEIPTVRTVVDIKRRTKEPSVLCKDAACSWSPPIISPVPAPPEPKPDLSPKQPVSFAIPGSLSEQQQSQMQSQLSEDVPRRSSFNSGQFKEKLLSRTAPIFEEIFKRYLANGSKPKRIGGEYLIELSESEGTTQGPQSPSPFSISIRGRRRNEDRPKRKERSTKHDRPRRRKNVEVTGDCNISNKNAFTSPLDQSEESQLHDIPSACFGPSHTGEVSILDFDDRPRPSRFDAFTSLREHTSQPRWSLLERQRISGSPIHPTTTQKTTYSPADTTLNHVQDFEDTSAPY